MTAVEKRFYRRLAGLVLAGALAIAFLAALAGRYTGAGLAAVSGALAGLLIWAHIDYFAFQYAYFLRMPALLYLLTLAVPVLLAVPLRTFGGNLLVLDTRQAAWVGAVLAIVAFAQAATARLIVRAAGSRTRLPIKRGDALDRQSRFDFGLRKWILVGALPVLAWGYPIVVRADADRLGVALTFLASTAVVYAASSWLLHAAGRAPSPPWLEGIGRWMGAGYADHAASHFGLLALTMVSMLLYLFGWKALEPPTPLWPSFPAVAYLLALILIFTWTLPSLSFLLDKYRISIALVVVPVWLILQNLALPDHYYALLPRPTQTPAQTLTAPSRASATEVLERRLMRSAQGRDPRPLIAVVASGGGITASLWTATVLANLGSLAAPAGDLLRDVALVSTASGGSVGAMFFVDGYTEAGPPSDGWALAEGAGTSSLTATAWGMVYPDFFRSFTGFFPVNKLAGRAWANEQVWGHGRNASTLAGWAPGVAALWRPLQIFNATEVETGAAVQLAALSVDGDDGAPDPLCCDPGVKGSCPERAADLGIHWAPTMHDMAITTAARLSATFPYVTPVSRALAAGAPCGNHLADGGYFDNYGVHAAVELLDRALTAYAGALDAAPDPTRGKPRVMLVQIEAFPPSTAAEPIPGWEGVTLGPLVTLLGVRTASQADRNRAELQLFHDKWSDVADIERFRFVLAPRRWPQPHHGRGGADGDGCALTALRGECGQPEPAGPAPLRPQDLPTSWQLSCAEKRTIVCHFARDAGAGAELERLRVAFVAARRLATP